MPYCTSISLKKPTPFLQFDRFYFVVGAGLLLFWCWVTFGWFQEPKLSQSSFYPQVYLLEFELHLTTVGRRCPAWNPHHHSSTTVLDSWLEGWGFKCITLRCSWKYTNLESERHSTAPHPPTRIRTYECWLFLLTWSRFSVVHGVEKSVLIWLW